MAAPSLQWRDRAGFSPASILASALRYSGQAEEHKTVYSFYLIHIITVELNLQDPAGKILRDWSLYFHMDRLYLKYT